MKIPALNVAHVCGTVTMPPTALPASDRSGGAIFELATRTYERGRKTLIVSLTVVCWGTLADSVLARVREHDVVLITGSLQNHRSSRNTLELVASVVQFLTSDDVKPAQHD
jgi:single-stranded DNA-binding protein